MRMEPDRAAISSQRYLASLGMVAALSASEVVVAAVAGVGGVRLVLLALSAFVFAIGYAAVPGSCKCTYDRRDLDPLLAMIGACAVAIGVTGGIASPMLGILPAPFMIGWMMFNKQREAAALGAVIPLILVVLIVVPSAWLEVRLQRSGYVALAVWTTMLSATLISRRIRRLFASMRMASRSLDVVREGALSDVESRRRGMETMTTKLAHELKNPLSAIKSLAQLELRSVTDPKSQKRLEVMFSEAERMQALLKDYLSFARPIAELNVSEVELSDLMAEINVLLSGRAEAAGIELSVKGIGGSVRADSRLLKEALVNVAANALEATPRGGSVNVTYHVGAQSTRIVVRDTGIGMAPEVRNRIGTPFFTTRDAGTGLGVVIAKTAISQHRGTLEYTSTPGLGTTATIAFPRDQTVRA